MSKTWDDNSYLRQIVVRWFRRSQDEQQGFDEFDKFIALWISFDAWGCNESGAIERPMIDWVAESDMAQVFQKAWSKLEPDLIALRAKGSIPSHTGRTSVTISDIHDFRNVLNAIYQIRNNLFHGHKLPDDKDDRDFVLLAYHIMCVLMEPFVRQLEYR